MTRQFTPCWPGECLATVCLTFDDGPPSQLKTAAPMLDKADLQATFYLNPRGDDFLEKAAPWRDVARAGHEIGNHTIGHTCSRAFRPDPAARGLENMTLQDIEKDIVEAKLRLQQLVPEQQEMSFCYPCHMEHVGCGPTRQSYAPVVAGHHIAGRGKGEGGKNETGNTLDFLQSNPLESGDFGLHNPAPAAREPGRDRRV